jgi:hypothetical protein
VHVDGAWADEQRLGDLAIRPAYRDEAEHLELTSRHAVGGGQALDCQPTLPLAASAMPTRSSVSARPCGARSPRMSMACHREVDVGHLGPAWV